MRTFYPMHMPVRMPSAGIVSPTDTPRAMRALGDIAPAPDPGLPYLAPSPMALKGEPKTPWKALLIGALVVGAATAGLTAWYYWPRGQRRGLRF